MDSTVKLDLSHIVSIKSSPVAETPAMLLQCHGKKYYTCIGL